MSTTQSLIEELGSQTAMPMSTRRQLDRWYPLKPHPVQEALVKDKIRFKLVPAGRRSGKTEKAKRFLASEAWSNPGEAYFICAPTREQVKKIYWEDMKKLCLTSIMDKRPRETDLTIFLNNGSTITLIGLDKPERFEGVFWTGGVIDEIADIKAIAWEAHIRPALDTFNPTRPDYRAWCWLIGVPDGLNHYFDMCEKAGTEGYEDWKVYHWISADILPEETIRSAKLQMSTMQYKQEYEASFETATGRIYADYSKANQTTERVRPHETLIWAHDQNYTPMSSAIAVRRPDGLYVVDEIVLDSAVARNSAEEFVVKFKDHPTKKVIIYGDPAGRAGEKHGQASDYTEIERVLTMHKWQFLRMVKPAAPAIKDRQNAVRAMICNAAGQRRLFVNPRTAPTLSKGLANTQFKKGSTFQEEQSREQHITTAIGYWIEHDYPTTQSGNSSNVKLTGT